MCGERSRCAGARLGYMDACWDDTVKEGFTYTRTQMYDKASDKQDSYKAHHQIQSKTRQLQSYKNADHILFGGEKKVY